MQTLLECVITLVKNHTHPCTEDYCTDARDVMVLRNGTKSSELEGKPFRW